MAQLVLLALALVLPPAGALPDGLRILAFPLALAGGTLIGLGAAALGSSLTILPRPPARGQFVRRGIYRVLRHPIYAGVILLVLAWACWRTSLLHAGLAFAIAAFFGAKARREEQWLLERFPAYAAYRRAVGAFVPRIR